MSTPTTSPVLENSSSESELIFPQSSDVNGDSNAEFSLNATTPTPSSSSESSSEDGLNVIGLISLIVFYCAVLMVGLWAGWKRKKEAARHSSTKGMSEGGLSKMRGDVIAGIDGGGGGDLKNHDEQESVMLAGRNIGLVVGIMTMGATWVGGGFINGSAEAAYTYGLVWVQAPFGFGLSLVIGGSFFASKMRDAKYVTMIDPFTQKYGRWGALQVIPAAMSEIFWSASILGALGTTLQVILKIEVVPSIIASAVISVLYTLLGGMISVAYTDVFQLIFIAFGLVLALPFAVSNENVKSIDFATTDWRGEVPYELWGEWFDFALLLLLGGIPWQAYFQRVLSAKSTKRAKYLSFGGAAIAITLAIPATLFGAIAKATDWTSTSFGRELKPEESGLVLPLSLQYLTPQWVSFFGLGAISAAVMSSTDSSMLSASSMLARNLYAKVFRPSASDREVLMALWVFIIVNACIATALAITYQSVYSLFVLCADFVYVVLFPQLLLVLYFPKTNTYGSVAAFFFSFLFRLLCGDQLLGIPAAISFGHIYNPDDPEKFGPMPFRTFIMLLAIVIQITCSLIADYIFAVRQINLGYDFFKCFIKSSEGIIKSSSSRFLDEYEINSDDVKLTKYTIAHINEGFESTKHVRGRS